MKPTKTFILLIILAFGQSCSKLDSEKKIQTAFQNWKQSQIKNNKFVADSYCNFDYVIVHEEAGLILGFPDQINFDYADLNGDQKIDALVTFFPNQCDGGNTVAWIQYQLLILSEQSEYNVNDSFFEKIKLSTESGFYHLDSIDNTGFYGTFFDFKSDDGYCCPSIEEPIKVNFKTKKIEIIETAY